MKEIMKRKFISIAVIVLSVICMMFATSCFGFIFDDFLSESKDNMLTLVECLEKEDRSAIKALFAPNKIADIENFDDDIEDLLRYYNGGYVAHKSGGTMSARDNDHGKVIEWHDMSYDIVTTEDTYRFGIEWCVECTYDKGEVGIWSLNIIRFDDDLAPEYSYRGDGTDTYGITIGKRSMYDYMTVLLACLEGGTPQDFKALFAPNKIKDVKTIDNDIEKLYSFYKGVECGGGGASATSHTEKTEGGVINYYDYTRHVITTVTSYRFVIRWCVEDTANPGNVGLWSLYVKEFSEEDWQVEYWGDGLWTNGVNIVVESVDDV